FALAGPVIDFLEQLAVLTDLCVVRIQFERLLVRFACLVELALVLVRNAEVVESRYVSRVQLRSFFPPIDGFPPEPTLGDVDAELDLRLGLASRIRENRRRRRGAERRDEDQDWHFHDWDTDHYSVLFDRTEQAICHRYAKEN